MLRRIYTILAAVLLLISVTLVVWQGSFRTGDFGPGDPEQTFVFFGISTIIFVLMVALGFMIARLIFKIWMERQGNRIGSRIRTKLVVGALALSLMPVFFMVLESVYVLNNTLERWFNRPVEHELIDFKNLSEALKKEIQEKAQVQAELLARAPEITGLLIGDPEATAAGQSFLGQFCVAHGSISARVVPVDSESPAATWSAEKPGSPARPRAEYEVSHAPVIWQGAEIGHVILTVPVPVDIAKQQRDIAIYDRAFSQLRDGKKLIRTTSLQLLTVIALFILFVASWLAQYFARQISTPISALLQGAEEVRKGNLLHRVDVKAVDELAQLVDGFNRMTADLDGNRKEIEARRRFTEAVLESIPTGVISVDSGGRIQLLNKALDAIFPGLNASTAKTLDDLFQKEEAAEIRYLMNRARRTGLASQQFEIKTGQRTLQLAITVSALEGRRSSGFVVVLEDTSDLLRAQKSAAWSEVARRVAHEIKNPLTPITLSAERIVRQTRKVALPPEVNRLLVECTDTILNETASVKRLVDEFSQFSRLPAAKRIEADLNDVVHTGLAVFEGRLDGIAVETDFAPNLPPVLVDPEQFKRVVVNLVDNAAEAMQDVPTRRLRVQTRLNETECVELILSDSGCGVTPEQREKLFLPYFSTKGRGTGLGLAIVSHILAEHDSTIRVEENRPSGTVFTIEIPAMVAVDMTPEAAEHVPGAALTA